MTLLKKASLLLLSFCLTFELYACGDVAPKENEPISEAPEHTQNIDTETEFLETETETTEIEESEIEESEIEETQSVEERIAFYKEYEAAQLIDVSDFGEEEIDELFYYEEISDALFERIYGLSFKVDCTVSRDSLRYVRLLYADLDGNTHIGELIVNKGIADDVIEIFRELYRNQYAIERMVLVDDYDADDTKSMEANNTSCFNFRVVEGSTNLSKHARGLAIDLNPQYNPYVHKVNGKTVISPENGIEYADRSKAFDYKIDREDLAYRLFMEHGFTWGGSWNSVKDYQHFQKEI